MKKLFIIAALFFSTQPVWANYSCLVNVAYVGLTNGTKALVRYNPAPSHEQDLRACIADQNPAGLVSRFCKRTYGGVSADSVLLNYYYTNLATGQTVPGTYGASCQFFLN